MLVDQPNVIAIDFGNHQRHVGLHAQGAGVGDDRAAGGGKLRFQFPGNRGIERGKDDFRRTFGFGGRNLHPGDVARVWQSSDASVQLPHRAVLPSDRKPRATHFKPRVMFQHLDESLADDAGGTENSYR